MLTGFISPEVSLSSLIIGISGFDVDIPGCPVAFLLAPPGFDSPAVSVPGSVVGFKSLSSNLVSFEVGFIEFFTFHYQKKKRAGYRVELSRW